LPFIIGLLLTPVGAAIGAIFFFTVLALTAPHPPHGNELVGMTILGLIPGLFFAAPVTILALPITCIVLNRKSAISMTHLAIAGAAFGFLSVLIAVLWIWWRDPVDTTDREFWLLTFGIAVDGAVAGAACGALLAAIMRGVGWHDRWHLTENPPG
jgi:hypothetical protein